MLGDRDQWLNHLDAEIRQRATRDDRECEAALRFATDPSQDEADDDRDCHNDPIGRRVAKRRGSE